MVYGELEGEVVRDVRDGEDACGGGEREEGGGYISPVIPTGLVGKGGEARVGGEGGGVRRLGEVEGGEEGEEGRGDGGGLRLEGGTVS